MIQEVKFSWDWEATFERTNKTDLLNPKLRRKVNHERIYLAGRPFNDEYSMSIKLEQKFIRIKIKSQKSKLKLRWVDASTREKEILLSF